MLETRFLNSHSLNYFISDYTFIINFSEVSDEIKDDLEQK